MFFAYNNGIAATASAATVVNGSNGLHLTKVTDLQIVNGGQTTASLAAALSEKDAGLVVVPLRAAMVEARLHVPGCRAVRQARRYNTSVLCYEPLSTW
jgi:hypothetical protein